MTNKAFCFVIVYFLLTKKKREKFVIFIPLCTTSHLQPSSSFQPGSGPMSDTGWGAEEGQSLVSSVRQEASASLPVISSQTAGRVTTTALPLSIIHAHSMVDWLRRGHHAHILLLLYLVCSDGWGGDLCKRACVCVWYGRRPFILIPLIPTPQMRHSRSHHALKARERLNTKQIDNYHANLRLIGFQQCSE